MKKESWKGLSGAMLLAISLDASAEEVFGPLIYGGMNARFDPATQTRYSQPEPELRLLLVDQKANARTNHFCLLGYRWPNGHEFVSVHWREGQLIMRWHGGTDWADGLLAAVVSDGVDLETSVIESDDTGTSNFLVPRRKAEGTIEDCRRHGREYVIEPFTPPPPVEEE